MRAYMEKTKINKDKGGPRRTLVERASDNTQGGADAFKQSERIIKSTQAMTDGLKLKEKTAADEMEADAKEMARLDQRARRVPAEVRRRLPVLRRQRGETEPPSSDARRREAADGRHANDVRRVGGAQPTGPVQVQLKARE